ncbi:thioredoxin domain-containing protein [Georgenia sp. MJ173]|uniref:DsbA family protein n=1 Tax=Georgenia sunbinii TaxID=3117728 RepID=UPI002F265038
MTQPASRARSLLVPAIIVVVAIALLVVSLVLSNDDDGDIGSVPADQGTVESDAPARVVTPEAQPTLDLARRDAEDPLAVGPADAEVTLIVYSDYQCPFCASWATDTGPVMEEYAADGELRIEFRDIAIFGKESRDAAHAAYAAGLQGHYLDYQRALFPGGDKLPPRGLREPALIDMAEQIGLDTERFAADLASPEVAAAVQRNVDEAAEIGAFSTPAFLLAGQPILGAQPTDVFVQALDAALGQAAG